MQYPYICIFKRNTMTEKEKCRAGMPYNPNCDPELQQNMMQAADSCFRYNNTPPSHVQERDEILTALLGGKGANCCIRQKTVLWPAIRQGLTTKCFSRMAGSCWQKTVASA